MSQDAEDYVDVELGSENAYDHNLLIPPSARRLGGQDADVKFKKIKIRIGRRPTAKNLRRVYELTGRAVPQDIEVFRSYDLWLLTNSFSVLKEGGFDQVQQVGFSVFLREEPKCSVQGILPTSEFIKRLGMDAVVDAHLALSGQLQVPELPAALSTVSESISTGGDIKVSTDVSLVGRISFSVMTPTIQAIGVGDNQSTWLFQRLSGSRPLLGDQVVTQVIVTPKRLSQLVFDAEVFANVSTFGWICTRLAGQRIELSAIMS